MECFNCGITPGDLPLEKDEAEQCFTTEDGKVYCIPCDPTNNIWDSDGRPFFDYDDYGDGSGYDYYYDEDEK